MLHLTLADWVPGAMVGLFLYTIVRIAWYAERREQIRADLEDGGYGHVRLKGMKIKARSEKLVYRRQRPSGNFEAGFSLIMVHITDEYGKKHWRPAITYRGERRIVTVRQLQELVERCEDLDNAGYGIFDREKEFSFRG